MQQLERSGQVAEQSVHRIVEAAKKTEGESIRGREVVDASVSVMLNIQIESQKIADKSKELLGRVAEVDAITALVGEISEQSAVLAINAAIEASKAGEFGEGFGVVADNMQELAQRSKESTMRIAEVLGAIASSINEISHIASGGRASMEMGVDTIRRSGEIVRNLSEEMKENSTMAENIYQSIEQQMTGLSYIAKAVLEFTSTVEENKGISRSLAMGSHKLGTSIKNMLDTLESWETPEFYNELTRDDSFELPTDAP